MITWTRCEDAMPDTVGEYLICYEEFGYEYFDIAYISDDVFIIEGEVVVCPTYWTTISNPLDK